ncbi:hypothetical protein AKO1_008758 [Acrasis kona]|uniref:Uncharacterized protein n=1 Tax=Acrasis kona TaxID=1008807 RepID=A0AAW2ZGR2_9EUKA
MMSNIWSSTRDFLVSLVQDPRRAVEDSKLLLQAIIQNPLDYIPLLAATSVISGIFAGLSIRSFSIHSFRSIPNKQLRETVIITGATSGIGRELAFLFARDGYSIIIVARNIKQLEETRRLLLETNKSIEVFCISKDLSIAESAKEVFNEVHTNPMYSHLCINNFINNAGVVMRGEFLRMDLDKQSDMIDLNISGLTRLFHLFGSEFARRIDNGSKQKFRILNLASFASFTPNPNMACYGATKSYIHYLSMAVHEELKARYGSQLSVSALCPGLVDTAAVPKSGTQHSILYKLGQYDTPERAAKIGYHTMMRGERYAIVGYMNGIVIYLCQAVLPYWLQAKCARIGTSDWSSLKLSAFFKDQLRVYQGNEKGAEDMAFASTNEPTKE